MSGKAVLDIAAGCDADCLFCLRNTLRTGDEVNAKLDLGGLEAFLSAARLMGIPDVLIGGDEPTVLGPERLGSVVGLCRDAGFPEVGLTSNGIALSDAAYLEGLVARGVNAFYFPLYGPSSEIHDAVTQRPGSFLAVRAAARAAAQAPGVRVILHSIFLRQNERHWAEMEQLAAEWGCPLEAWTLSRLFSHVDYASLEPVGEPNAGFRASRRAASRGPVIKYNVLLARLNWDLSYHEDGISLVRDFFSRRGASLAMIKAAFENFERKPILRDPRRFLRLLRLAETGKFGDGELRPSH